MDLMLIVVTPVDRMVESNPAQSHQQPPTMHQCGQELCDAMDPSIVVVGM